MSVETISTTRREFISRVAHAVPVGMLWSSRGPDRNGVLKTSDSPPIFYDDDGLIVHKGRNGGDTAQREGWYWVGRWIWENKLKIDLPSGLQRTRDFPTVLHLLEPKGDGIFYRHPKLVPWNNPFDKEYGFSRDQMIPLVAAMGLWGHEEPLRRLWNALPQDVVGGTKHTFNGSWVTVFGQKTVYTGDVITPATINLFRRAWNEDPIKAGDNNGLKGEEELAANAGLRCPPLLTDRDNTGDDLNLIVMLLISLLRCHTDVSIQASEWYAQNRLVNYGCFMDSYRDKCGDIPAGPPNKQERSCFDNGISSGWKTDCSRVYGAVRWYHRAETGANPKLAELYAPIIHKYFE